MVKSTVASLTREERAELLEGHRAGKSLDELWRRAREFSPQLSRTAVWRYLKRKSRDEEPATRKEWRELLEMVQQVNSKVEILMNSLKHWMSSCGKTDGSR